VSPQIRKKEMVAYDLVTVLAVLLFLAFVDFDVEI